MKKNLPILASISLLLIVGLTPIFAEETAPIITIEFVNGDVLDIANNDRLIRAKIIIENYEPQDGFHFMRVTNMATNEIVRDSEIIPLKQGDVYVAQVSHYLDTMEDLSHYVGEYEVQIYSEFGSELGLSTFKIVDSKNTPLPATESSLEIQNTESTNSTTVETLESTPTTSSVELPESNAIPRWVQSIFIWYAEGTIGEQDLLQALEYLIENDVIKVNLN